MAIVEMDFARGEDSTETLDLTHPNETYSVIVYESQNIVTSQKPKYIITIMGQTGNYWLLIFDIENEQCLIGGFYDGSFQPLTSHNSLMSGSTGVSNVSNNGFTFNTGIGNTYNLFAIYY